MPVIGFYHVKDISRITTARELILAMKNDRTLKGNGLERASLTGLDAILMYFLIVVSDNVTRDVFILRNNPDIKSDVLQSALSSATETIETLIQSLDVEYRDAYMNDIKYVRNTIQHIRHIEQLMKELDEE